MSQESLSQNGVVNGRSSRVVWRGNFSTRLQSGEYQPTWRHDSRSRMSHGNERFAFEMIGGARGRIFRSSSEPSVGMSLKREGEAAR
jgi:hypothetical protein